MVDFHFFGVNLSVLGPDLRVYLFIYGIIAIYTLLFLIAKWYVVRNSNAIWVLSSALFCVLNTVLDAQKHFKWDTFPKWHHCDPLGIEDRTHVWENHALPITLIMFLRVFAIIIINNVTNNIQSKGFTDAQVKSIIIMINQCFISSRVILEYVERYGSSFPT